MKDKENKSKIIRDDILNLVRDASRDGALCGYTLMIIRIAKSFLMSGSADGIKTTMDLVSLAEFLDSINNLAISLDITDANNPENN